MTQQDAYAEPFRRIQPDEAKQLIDAGGVQLVDVREAWEYANNHIPNSALKPLKSIIASPGGQISGDNIIFICEVGQRSAVAAEVAASLGIENMYNLEGGMTAWRRSGYPVEK